MAVVKKLSTSPEVIEEPKLHEPHSQDDLQTSIYSPFPIVEEIKESCTTSDGEQPLEPEIEEFLTCLSSNLQCTQETNYIIEEDLHSMTKERFQSG